MSITIRGLAATVNYVVGPFVILVGAAAGIAATVLTWVLESAGFLMLFLPSLLAIGAGVFILWSVQRSGLRIDAHGFSWCGPIRPAQSLRWEQVHQLRPPPSGSPRTVVIAQLHDGRRVEVRAIWDSPTSSLLIPVDHSRAQNALLSAHQEWLAARR
ncbi:hypothetical protein [Brachybacterium vulturis]|uniref:hypothetical protein n=1 Tax=Brachybacterium vulturis TaxID=2017484 RepID=UPI0037362ECB